MKATKKVKKAIPAGAKPRATEARKQSKKAKEEAVAANAEEEAVNTEASKESTDAKKLSKKSKKKKTDAANELAVPKDSVAETAEEVEANGDDESEAEAKDDDEPKEPKEPKCSVYLGGIPDGFQESEMKRFFNQFGRVTQLRLSRSKKTARPKGYGFIEFKERSVAKIVAETMDKYLLFGKQMQCHLLEGDKRHPRLYRGAHTKFEDRRPKRRTEYRTNYNDRPTVEVDGEEIPQATMRQVLRRNSRKKSLKAKLERFGVDYDPDEAVDTAGAGSAKASELASLTHEPDGEAKKEPASDAAPRAKKPKKSKAGA